MKAKHPMQPIELDTDGVARFKANAIVVWLFQTNRINLNEIPIGQFAADDIAQFWQLLGYSVSGYGELSFIPTEIVAAADAEAERLLKETRR